MGQVVPPSTSIWRLVLRLVGVLYQYIFIGGARLRGRDINNYYKNEPFLAETLLVREEEVNLNETLSTEESCSPPF